jgi:hypothetical protein
MLSRVKELKKLPQLEEPKKLDVHSRRGKTLETLKQIGINNVDYHECKHSISLSGEIYCGMWKEKVNGALCKYCPYFDREPLDYRLFRRT